MKTESDHHYPHIGRKEDELDAHYWEGLYQSGETAWDHGEASPGLMDFLSREDYRPGRILVPGCGRGHEARALGQAGFDVTGLDFAKSAVSDAVDRTPSERINNVRFEKADFFDLPKTLRGPYDWIFENTFFCAIDPAFRERYVELAADLLGPEGHFLGVFYHIQPETGPPFGSTREELIERFSKRFTLIEDKVPRSFPSRENKELLMLWKKS